MKNQPIKFIEENSSDPIDPTDTPVSVVVDGLISTIVIIAALLGTYYVYFR